MNKKTSMSLIRFRRNQLHVAITNHHYCAGLTRFICGGAALTRTIKEKTVKKINKYLILSYFGENKYELSCLKPTRIFYFGWSWLKFAKEETAQNQPEAISG